jgi:hypothetical protein
MKFIIVADHPYYPQVEYCSDINNAKKMKKEFETDLLTHEGKHDCRVSISQILEISEGRSEY